jgi:hypothetical protein
MLSASSAKRFVKRALRSVRNTWIRGLDQARLPVIVYQMGKVGSSSLRDSLKERGVWPVSHAHRINPKHVEEIKEHRAQRGFDSPLPTVHIRGLELHREIVEPGRSSKFISLIREPVSRNVSAFFFNYVANEDGYGNLSLQEIRESFLSEYPHEVPLVWFDREPKVTLNIDVYDTPFPNDQGYVELSNGPFELLVMQSELPDARKADAIQQFLEISDFQIQRRNTGQRKSYGNVYDAFKQKISLPNSYLDRMLQSRYAQHFYSTEEIEQTYNRWS